MHVLPTHTLNATPTAYCLYISKKLGFADVGLSHAKTCIEFNVLLHVILRHPSNVSLVIVPSHVAGIFCKLEKQELLFAGWLGGVLLEGVTFDAPLMLNIASQSLWLNALKLLFRSIPYLSATYAGFVSKNSSGIPASTKVPFLKTLHLGWYKPCPGDV